MNWLQIQFQADSQTAPTLETALEEAGAVSVTMVDAEDQPVYEPGPGETPLWRHLIVTGLFTGDCQEESVVMSMATAWLPAALPDYSMDRIEDQDWERAWMDDFKPMPFGKRLWICPSTTAPPDPEAVNILLDPGLAFGTGTHPTTALCLEWLDTHPPTNQTVIDYGCGSGILGIAALLLGAEKTIGVDNDPQALLATRDNCLKNNLEEECFPVYLPDDFFHLQKQETLTFPVDGILANILAQPLMELSATLASLVKADGWLVLSGILEEQADQIMAKYTPWFELEPPEIQEGWVRISGRRRTSTPT